MHQTISLDRIKEINSIYEIYYQQIGCYCLPDHFVERENADFYMLQLCVSGEGFYKCGETNYEIRAGDMFFCYPNMYNSYGSSAKNPWTVYWAHFYGSGVEKLLKNLNIWHDRPVFHIGVSHVLTALFDAIINKDPYAEDSELMICQGIFNQLLFSAIKSLSSKSSDKSRMSETIKRSIDYIQENSDQKLSLSDICTSLNISVFYFSHLFKNEVGLTPNQYVIKSKMERAKTLLINTNKTISEIAGLVGFDNCMYFSNVFKKHFSISPRAYRKT